MGALLLPVDSPLHVGKKWGGSCALIRAVSSPGHFSMPRLGATGIKNSMISLKQINLPQMSVGVPPRGVGTHSEPFSEKL